MTTAVIEPRMANLRVYDGVAGRPHPYTLFLELVFDGPTRCEIVGLADPEAKGEGRKPVTTAQWRAIFSALYHAGVRTAWWRRYDSQGREEIHGVRLSESERGGVTVVKTASLRRRLSNDRR